MASTDELALELQLVERLQHRAQQVTVHNDLAAVLASEWDLVEVRQARSDEYAGTGLRWLAIAAALFAFTAGGGALANRVSNRAEATNSPSQQLSDGLTAAAATSEIDIIIWLDPKIEPLQVQRIALWLGSQADVSDYNYLDQAETYVEFAEYFEDKPQVIELVEPEDLPPSFRVSTTSPDAIADGVRKLPGVADAELPD